METLRNKRKLAAVSIETPNSSRGSKGWNVLDPELTQDYISLVSEEIEGRVTKKLSKEFNSARDLTSFSLTHKCGLVPYFRERLETLTPKAGKFMGTAPQPNLILKGGVFLTTRDNSIVLRQTW